MQQASRDTTPVRTEHDTWPDAGPRQLGTLPQMVSEVMSRPVCVPSTASLTRVGRALGHGHVRALVVVDESKRPLGVITPEGLLAVVSQRQQTSLGDMRAVDAPLLRAAVLPDTTRVDMAAHVLARTPSDFALVTSRTGAIEGLVFAGDVLRALGW
ncbi:MAG: CBS domain-containing protein [Myxococcales bacterium]|nr:CBS domain-containing protein [Myxococcales bacterium]MCB9575486.1 CBS domain-containing protein [Polyangiaceae bacterium]